MSTDTRLVANFIPTTQTEPERQQQIEAFMQRLTAFLSGEVRRCPYCDREVVELKRRRTSVTAQPCGCHVYQGKAIPATWQPA
jgi:uncharacterized protein with PIN domain